MNDLLRDALDAAARLGLDDVECVFVDASSTRVAVSGGVVESLEERRERGFGVRVFLDRRPGFAYGTDLSSSGIARVLVTARDLAGFAAPDDANRAPGPAGADATAPAPRNVDPALESVPVARKVALAREVEAAARAVAPEVDRVRKAAYRDVRQRMLLGTTRGLTAATAATRAWLSIEAAARRAGDQRTGSYADWALGADGLDPERVGRTGAGRALSMLGARPGRTARVPVVLDPEVTASLLSALAPAFSALRVLRHRTVLEGREGTAIGAACVSIVDDATLEGTWGAREVDGEGQPTRRLHLVRDGVLGGFLHDGYTARRFGVESTGHAQRGGFGAPPAIGPHAVHLLPTGPTRDEVLAAAQGGLYVRELMGLHTVNPTTGDFSLGVSGQEIGAGGELGAPVDRIAVSGSILPLLGSFSAVADDIVFPVGAAGGATVLLQDMPVSGA